jgi:hypothetical protein
MENMEAVGEEGRGGDGTCTSYDTGEFIG